MLSGRSLDARPAKRMGLVDYAVPQRHLRDAARRMIAERAGAAPGGAHPAADQHALGAAVARPRVPPQVGQGAREAHYPAPYALIELWQDTP